PGPGRDASPLCRLPDAVLGFQRARFDRRLWLRPGAGVLPVRRGAAGLARQGRAGAAATLERSRRQGRGRPGVGNSLAGAVSYVRDAAPPEHHCHQGAGRARPARTPLNEGFAMTSGQKKNNLRMALILASVAAVFFVGIVLKMAWLAH